MILPLLKGLPIASGPDYKIFYVTTKFYDEKGYKITIVQDTVRLHSNQEQFIYYVSDIFDLPNTGIEPHFETKKTHKVIVLLRD